MNTSDIVSGAFQLNEGFLPDHVSPMVVIESEEVKQNVPAIPRMPLIPEMPVSSSFGAMPAVSEARSTAGQLPGAQAPNGEFVFVKEVKQLRSFGFNQESRLRDVLTSTSGNVDQSLRELNARRRFKYPTAFAAIKQMGFSNDEVIKALLMKHHGDKEAVVFEMLG